MNRHTRFYRNDPLLRAAEGDTGASPPAQYPTEPRGGGRGSASIFFASERNPDRGFAGAQVGQTPEGFAQ